MQKFFLTIQIIFISHFTVFVYLLNDLLKNTIQYILNKNFHLNKARQVS